MPGLLKFRTSGFVASFNPKSIQLTSSAFVSGNNQARSLRWTKRPSPAFLLFDCPTASIRLTIGKAFPAF